MTVIPYSELPNYPEPRDLRKSDIEQIATMYYRFSSLTIALNGILKNPAQSIIENDVTLDGLRKLQDSIEGFKTTLRKHAQALSARASGTQRANLHRLPQGIAGF